MIPARTPSTSRSVPAALRPHYKRVPDLPSFHDVNMAHKLNLPTPPLSAAASESEKRFSFDDAQSEAGYAPVQVLRGPRYERKMGDTELSYFLPSRQTGVNDMWVVLSRTSETSCSPASSRYLHLGFKAKESITKRSRVCAVWAILRLRHPSLCARAEMHDYNDVRFV